MPRAHTILQAQFPYNISARSINKEWFDLSMEKVWRIFAEELTVTTERYKLEIHSFVLMSNHFHLIVTTPEANISQAMQYFMGHSSRRLTREGDRINQSFGSRYYKCILQSTNYFLNAYKYNYRNPVTAGLCHSVEDYPFSTLQDVMGLKTTTIPLIDDLTYSCDPEGTMNWLNQAPSREKLEAARQGFRKPYFKSKKCRLTNKAILGEDDVL